MCSQGLKGSLLRVLVTAVPARQGCQTDRSRCYRGICKCLTGTIYVEAECHHRHISLQVVFSLVDEFLQGVLGKLRQFLPCCGDFFCLRPSPNPVSCGGGKCGRSSAPLLACPRRPSTSAIHTNRHAHTHTRTHAHTHTRTHSMSLPAGATHHHDHIMGRFVTYEVTLSRDPLFS